MQMRRLKRRRGEVRDRDDYRPLGRQRIESRRIRGLVFVRRLLAHLAMSMAEIGLRIVHVHGHGFRAGHARLSHCCDFCSLRASTRTGVTSHSQLHE